MRERGAGTRLERGAAAVEFAIILPLLLLMVGGIVDFGRAYFTQITLTNAAREGARAAVVRASGPEVVARIDAAIAVPLSGGVTITPPSPSCPSSGGGAVSVTLTNDFNWIILEPALNLIPGASSVLPDKLSSTAKMQCGG